MEGSHGFVQLMSPQACSITKTNAESRVCFIMILNPFKNIVCGRRLDYLLRQAGSSGERMVTVRLCLTPLDEAERVTRPETPAWM